MGDAAEREYELYLDLIPWGLPQRCPTCQGEGWFPIMAAGDNLVEDGITCWQCEGSGYLDDDGNPIEL